MENQIKGETEPLPEYLKHLLNFCGFASSKLFAKLDNNDIDEMEMLGRTYMVKIVPNTKQYFHLFANNPVQFQILPGHKKLLLITKDLLASKCSQVSHNKSEPENQCSSSSSAKLVGINKIEQF